MDDKFGNYKMADFEGLKYNVIKEGTDILGKIPLLNNIASFKKSTANDLDCVIKYIVLMYDKRSPLVMSGKDPKIKHKEAIEISGLKRNVEESTEIIDMTIDYLKDQNDLMWAMLVSNESTFWEYQRIIAEPITDYNGDKDKISASTLKSKLLSDCHDIINRVESYYVKIFHEKKIIEKAKSRALTPEMIAKRNV